MAGAQEAIDLTDDDFISPTSGAVAQVNASSGGAEYQASADGIARRRELPPSLTQRPHAAAGVSGGSKAQQDLATLNASVAARAAQGQSDDLEPVLLGVTNRPIGLPRSQGAPGSNDGVPLQQNGQPLPQQRQQHILPAGLMPVMHAAGQQQQQPGLALSAALDLQQRAVRSGLPLKLAPTSGSQALPIPMPPPPTSAGAPSAPRQLPSSLQPMAYARIAAAMQQQQQQQQQQAHVGGGVAGTLAGLVQQQQGSSGIGAAAAVQGQGHQRQLLLYQQQQQQAAAAAAAVQQGPTLEDVQRTRSALQAVIGALERGTGKEAEPPAGTMMTSLLRHQKLALGWMKACEARGGETGGGGGSRTRGGGPAGGMLCDDQGLGKTISTIALIVTDPGGGGEQQQQQHTGVAAAAAEPSNGGDALHPLPSAPDSRRPSPSPIASSSGRASGGGSKGGGGGPCGSSKSLSPPLQQGGGTLVVCPTAVLNQWEGELRSKLTADALRGLGGVHKYHGPGRVQDPRLLAGFGVVLTTFTTMANEAPERPDERQGTSSEFAISLDDDEDDDGSSEDDLPSTDAAAMSAAASGKGARGGGGGGGPPRKRAKRSSRGGPLYRVAWRRVVLDEAQAIKNPRTLVAHAAWTIHAASRWCLSGTPIQNSVDDLYSYFRFLNYTPWSHFPYFKQHLKDVIATNQRDGYRKLQAVLQPVLLRRTKQSKIDGEPVVKLPPRNERLLRATFSERELSYYRQLEARSRKEIQALEGVQGGGQRRYVNMLLLLLRLRQACNHPGLVRGDAAISASGGSCGPRLPPASQQQQQHTLVAARKLGAERRQLLAGLLRNGLSPCGLCNDIGEDPVASKCGHLFCSTCIHIQVDGSSASKAEREVVFHCPCCGSPIGQHDVFSLHELEAAEGAVAAAAAPAHALQAAFAYGSSTMQQQQLGGPLSPPSSSAGLDFNGIGGAAVANGAAATGFAPATGPVPGPGPNSSGYSSSMGTASASDGGVWQSSSKIDALLQVLEDIRQRRQGAPGAPGCTASGGRPNPPPLRSRSAARITAGLSAARTRPPAQQLARRDSSSSMTSGGSSGVGSGGGGEKAIVYSQWTNMLDLLEEPLRQRKFEYRRLDGSMSVARRDEALRDFERQPAVTVLIVSLKAAAVGLNLTCASHVVLLDLWWNPTVEEQAIDRAHRIGQTRPVNVTRIVVKDSVEDRILELQDRKRQVVRAALAGEAADPAAGNSTRLTMDDLNYLFGGL